jgi:hypothetical protein
MTVIFAMPAPTPITTPFSDTVAIEVLLLLQLTALLVALVGVIAATRVSAPLTPRLMLDLFSETPVTAMELTVTVQVAVLPPSEVVTVIVADPGATAVTVPFSDTVATAVLLLLQLTALLVALVGVMVAIRVSEAPALRLREFLFNVTPVTATELVVDQVFSQMGQSTV